MRSTPDSGPRREDVPAHRLAKLLKVVYSDHETNMDCAGTLRRRCRFAGVSRAESFGRWWRREGQCRRGHAAWVLASKGARSLALRCSAAVPRGAQTWDELLTNTHFYTLLCRIRRVSTTVRIQVLLSETEAQRFQAFCDQSGFKKSTLVARLIRDYLDRQAYPRQGALFGVGAVTPAEEREQE